MNKEALSESLKPYRVELSKKIELIKRNRVGFTFEIVRQFRCKSAQCQNKHIRVIGAIKENHPNISAEDNERLVEMLFRNEVRKFWWKDRESPNASADVIDMDTDEHVICFENFPQKPVIFPYDFDYPVMIERNILNSLLEFSESPHLIPLAALFSPFEYEFSDFVMHQVSRFHVLNKSDQKVKGIEDQMKMVREALSTPDLAVLLGPPGSGKTTTITEIILQKLKRGEKVLLVASTHVAVDNVLERVVSEYLDIAFPLRVSRDITALSPEASRFTENNIVKDLKNRILDSFARNSMNLSPAQKEWKALLLEEGSESIIQEVIFDSINLVCGTTIGFSRYEPVQRLMIGKRLYAPNPIFDTMILDEASKTTVQEFLVPAYYSKTWIVSGDPNQLSPYVDRSELSSLIDYYIDEDLKETVSKDLEPRSSSGNAFAQFAKKTSAVLFQAFITYSRLIGTLGSVASSGISSVPNMIFICRDGLNRDFMNFLRDQLFYLLTDLRANLRDWIPSQENLDARTVELLGGFVGLINQELAKRNVVFPPVQAEYPDQTKRDHNGVQEFYEPFIELVSTPVVLMRRSDYNRYHRYCAGFSLVVPLDGKRIDPLDRFRFQHFSRLIGKGYQTRQRDLLEFEHDFDPDASDEVAWRLVRSYEQESSGIEARFEQWIRILPHLKMANSKESKKISVVGQIRWLRRIELPSIIECLIRGRDPRNQKIDDNSPLIERGFSESEREKRVVLMKYQHRMHKEISKYSKIYVYNNEALNDDPNIDREWYYNKYLKHFEFIDIKAGSEAPSYGSYQNESEARTVMLELKDFLQYAKDHQNSTTKEKGWIVAVLSFYEGQVALFRKLLFENKIIKSVHDRVVKLSSHNATLLIGNVDTMQGKEADVVFLSLVRTKRIGFLDSKNRVNVAITRAKFQNVLVGKLTFFQRQSLKERAPLMFGVASDFAGSIGLGKAASASGSGV